jgi:hypothetical protein
MAMMMAESLVILKVWMMAVLSAVMKAADWD